MSNFTRLAAAAVTLAAFATAPAMADKGGVPNGGNGSDNPHAAQPATPAQPGTGPATPAQPAPKAEKPKKQHPAHPVQAQGPKPKTEKPAKAKKPHPAHPQQAKGPKADSAPTTTEAPKSNPHAKAGKTTICHSTGSAKNPYVQITISNNAIPAHRRHHDGRDIIPAPADGCPGAAQQQPATGGQQQTAPATGEQPAAPQSGTEATTGSSLPAAGTGAPSMRVLGAHAVAPENGSAPASSRVAVLGAHATSPASAALPAARVSGARSGIAGLPFTGLGLFAIAAFGLALLLAGVALRRSETLGRRSL